MRGGDRGYIMNGHLLTRKLELRVRLLTIIVPNTALLRSSLLPFLLLLTTSAADADVLRSAGVRPGPRRDIGAGSTAE